MKSLFRIIILTLVVSCKAQIVSLDSNYWEYPQGAYIKDTFNQMDKYVGTWLFTNGTNTFEISLQKEIHVYNGEYYEDFLRGEYRYLNNGVETVNTLPSLNNSTFTNGENSNIQGRKLIKNNNYLTCNDCSVGEKRFMLSLWDPERSYLSLSLILRYLPQLPGEPEKMTVTLISNDSVMIPDENSPTEPRVPLGEYLMIKQ